ncbi:ARM repeat-containing protein [Mycena sanguinolenta]|uniref:ARM repeat-containing protein n=1 Tax=Mycena sanguinolenta TaxID=230812 RepID=A0A8H6YH85_9AGAR|nr:ARM repeat-containing protein [Mycena sanguinolenta]
MRNPSAASRAVLPSAPNANLLAGALLTEVKEAWRQPEIIDGYLDKIQRLALKSHKDAQKLVTAGVISTLILLLKTRAIDGVGLETVLLTLGILAYDPITANTIYRTGTSAILIETIDVALSDDMAALAVWCLARICRNAEIATELIKLNLGRLLVTKGLKGGQRTSRISAWCLGILIRSDNIADSLADMGLVNALCEHLRRCSESIDAGPEDYSAAVYAVARLSRSIKISKALAKGGCVGMLSHLLITAEDPRVLLWTARAVGCLMRPNSSDMAKLLLDAGVAHGLAHLPSMLPTEEVEPLGSFAFAIQRFSCAEWGSGTRKALADAGLVDVLLAASRTAADEPYPQVHIDLAYAIALLADVGGAPIRKQIVNAGGNDILKQIAGSTNRPDVAKACNLAATSINGNLWSRNIDAAQLFLVASDVETTAQLRPPPLLFDFVVYLPSGYQFRSTLPFHFLGDVPCARISPPSASAPSPESQSPFLLRTHGTGRRPARAQRTPNLLGTLLATFVLFRFGSLPQACDIALLCLALGAICIFLAAAESRWSPFHATQLDVRFHMARRYTPAPPDLFCVSHIASVRVRDLGVLVVSS